MTNILQDLIEVREKIAALENQETNLVERIIKAAKHTKTGQATYELFGQKVTIKTGENTTLDKALLNTVWKDTMPINRSYAYTLRQKDYDAIMKAGTPAQKQLLASIVSTKPAKPSVTIVAG